MDRDFHPASVKGTGAAIVDVVFAISVFATLATLILTLLNSNAQDQFARAYARQFRVAAEDDCPRSLGKPFWFSCASEARQLKAPTSPSPAK